MSGKPQSAENRLAALLGRVTPGHGGCWIWTGYVGPNGYGQFHLNGRKVLTHRASYELTTGRPVPDDLHIDHLCRVRRCIRPDHLEPVTQAENNNRAAGTRAKCRKNHPLDGLKISGGKQTRYCKTCHRIREAARHAAKRRVS